MKSIYVNLAFDIIKSELNSLKDDFKQYNDLKLEKSRACFVTLHNRDHSLRGCIGTIYPREDNIFDEIKNNAISAAFHDPRFQPIKIDELHNLIISVDILSEPVMIHSLDELDPKLYGVIVEDGYKKGVLLPDLPSVNSYDDQLNIAMQKAGIHKSFLDINIYKFSVNRYY